MGEAQNLPWITANDAYTWLAVATVSTLAGIFRVWRNGQWKSITHGAGVVGCSTILSGFCVSIVHWTAPSLASNVPTTLWLAGAVSVMGKDFHERLIIKTFERILGNDDKVSKDGTSKK